MSYLNTETNQYPVGESEIRAANPTTSYPLPFVAPAPFVYVFPAPPASYDAITHRAVEAAPELTEQGHYEQRWAIEPLDVELAEANQAYAAQALQSVIVAAVDRRLKAFAATRRYDGVDSVGKYITLTDAQINTLPEADRPIVRRYRAECKYLALATAQTWAKLEQVLADVLAGTRPVPTGYDDIEGELPLLEWPAA